MKLRKLLSRIFNGTMNNGISRITLFAVFLIGLSQLRLGLNQNEACGMILGLMIFETLVYLIPKLTRDNEASRVSATKGES